MDIEKWIKLIELVGPKAQQVVTLFLELLGTVLSGIGVSLATLPPDSAEAIRLKKVLVKNGTPDHAADELVSKIPVGQQAKPV